MLRLVHVVTENMTMSIPQIPGSFSVELRPFIFEVLVVWFVVSLGHALPLYMFF